MQVTHRRIAALVTAVLITVGASCGSDSESEASTTLRTVAGESNGAADGSSASGDDRDAIVEYLVSRGTDEALDLDRDCVAGVVDQLSDEDVSLLGPSLPEGDLDDVELSAEGSALGDTLGDCVIGSDDQAMIAQVVDKLLAEGGNGVDEECLRTNVAKLSDEQLQLVLESEPGSTGPESTDPRLQTAGFLLRDCVDVTSTGTG